MFIFYRMYPMQQSNEEFHLRIELDGRLLTNGCETAVFKKERGRERVWTTELIKSRSSNAAIFFIHLSQRSI